MTYPRPTGSGRINLNMDRPGIRSSGLVRHHLMKCKYCGAEEAVNLGNRVHFTCQSYAYREGGHRGWQSENCELRQEINSLSDGMDKIEELVAGGSYIKWQDQAWWMFWESSGEVAAGPAPSVRELAILLSNAKVADPKDSAH